VSDILSLIISSSIESYYIIRIIELVNDLKKQGQVIGLPIFKLFADKHASLLHPAYEMQVQSISYSIICTNFLFFREKCNLKFLVKDFGRNAQIKGEVSKCKITSCH
jgi:hypothetical protein